MSFQVNANIAALNVYNNLGVHQAKAADSLARISSGLKAAGGDIASGGSAAVITQNRQNTLSNISQVQNAINQLQVADAVYGEAMALVSQGISVAATAGNAGADASAITEQLTAISGAVASLSTNVQYNGARALVTAATPNIGAGSLTVTPATIAAIGTQDTAGYVAAAAAISDLRATNGGFIVALQNALQALNAVSANELSALGQAQDTDIATEMMNLTSANIMTEAATAMLAQAMQMPNSVLKLLQ
jgi:flagellin